MCELSLTGCVLAQGSDQPEESWLSQRRRVELMSRKVWELLMMLPTSPRLMMTFEAISNQEEEEEEGTMVQNNQEPRRKYWATHSSVRSYRSLIRWLRTARFARALRCAHSFARSPTSLTPSLVGKQIIRWLFYQCFFPIFDHSAGGHPGAAGGRQSSQVNVFPANRGISLETRQVIAPHHNLLPLESVGIRVWLEKNRQYT